MNEVRVKNAELAGVIYATGFCNGLMKGAGYEFPARATTKLVREFSKDFAMEFSLDEGVSLPDYFEEWIVGQTAVAFEEMLKDRNE